MSNITKLREQLRHYRYLATHDQLTGLLNRRGLDETGGDHYVVADLNGFKAAQDKHPLGHAFGDAVLCAFARFLELNIREGDAVACRSGGDEFVVRCDSRQGAVRIANMIVGWTYCGVSASAGVGSTVREADADCYNNKPR